MRLRCTSLAALSLLALSAATAPARADVTSWLAVAGGYGLEHNGTTTANDGAGAFSALIGIGSTPRAPLVFGGVFRSVTYFGLGTDISLAARGATGGFARGDWGGAIDLGLGYRYWQGGNFGRVPVHAAFTLGAPWGLEVAVGGDFFSLTGAPEARGAFAILEIDLLRLTLMRQGSTDRAWRNPSPAGGRDP